MLSLDDPVWTQLTHAYGAASDIPDRLRALARSPDPARGYQAEPWFTLCSSLCHQGDIYTASFAAVPHIVQIAMEAPGPIDSSFFHLPAAVEVARHNRRGPEIPVSLEADYHASLRRLLECASIHRSDAWDEDTVLSVAAAQAVANGHHRLAEAILNMDEYWIEKINNFDFE